MVAIVMTIVMVIRITMMASFIVISIAIMGIFLVRVHFGCCDCEFDLDISDNHSLLSFVWFYYARQKNKQRQISVRADRHFRFIR